MKLRKKLLQAIRRRAELKPRELERGVARLERKQAKLEERLKKLRKAI